MKTKILMMHLILLVAHFDYCVTRIKATNDSVISWHSHSCTAWIIMLFNRWKHNEFVGQ